MIARKIHQSERMSFLVFGHEDAAVRELHNAGTAEDAGVESFDNKRGRLVLLAGRRNAGWTFAACGTEHNRCKESGAQRRGSHSASSSLKTLTRSTWGRAARCAVRSDAVSGTSKRT